MKKNLYYLLIATFFMACSNDNDLPNPDPDPIEEKTVTFVIKQVNQTDLKKAILTLQSQDTLIRDTMKVVSDSLISKFEDLTPDNYKLSIHLLIGDNLSVAEEMSVHQGYAYRDMVNIMDCKQVISVKNPDNIDSEWSERIFYTHLETLPDVTVSYPKNACTFDMYVVPFKSTVNFTYVYIDYYVYGNTIDEGSLGLSECLSDCDPVTLIGEFDSLISDDKRNICNNEVWEMADSFITLITENQETEDDFVFFYQRWDENGEVVLPEDLDN